MKVFLPDRIVRSGHRSVAEYDGKHFVGNQLLPTLRAHDDDDQSGEKIQRLEEELRTCFGRSFNTGGDVDRILISGNVGFHVRNFLLEVSPGSHFKLPTFFVNFYHSCYWWKSYTKFTEIVYSFPKTVGLRSFLPRLWIPRLSEARQESEEEWRDAVDQSVDSNHCEHVEVFKPRSDLSTCLTFQELVLVKFDAC